MIRLSAVALIACFAMAACGTVPAQVEAPPASSTQPAPPPPNANAIPAGTVLTVRLTEELGTSAGMGEVFTATVVDPLVATNNQTVIPAGSVFTGMVTGVGTTAEGQAAIRLNFLRVAIDGVNHPLSARVVDTARPDGELPEQPPEAVTAAGAALGAVIGGDLRTAIVGGVLGAGAGTIVSLGTGDVEPVLAEGTLLRIQTRDRVELRP